MSLALPTLMKSPIARSLPDIICPTERDQIQHIIEGAASHKQHALAAAGEEKCKLRDTGDAT
jgi:hypothetical protein